MNNYLPLPGTFRRFEASSSLLKRIAAAMGAYVFLVLYPAYICLAWIYTGDVPGVWQVTIVALCTAAFSAYAYREMSKLTRPRQDAR